MHRWATAAPMSPKEVSNAPMSPKKVSHTGAQLHLWQHQALGAVTCGLFKGPDHLQHRCAAASACMMQQHALTIDQ